MKKILRKILFGDIPVSEYSTITVRSGITEKVWLETGDHQIDISSNHWLLCLSPVVFGIWFSKEKNTKSFDKNSGYKIYFKDSERYGNTVATISLDLFDKIEEADGFLLLLKLTKANIQHISRLKTQILFNRYYKKPEQDFFKLSSYAAAYSYPRKVRLISFKEDDYFNIFPMDLVGDIPQSNRYVFGLRHTNTTLARIIKTKKMVVSEIPYHYKDIIYQLGKHHSNPLSAAALPFDVLPSEKFEFPVPKWANSYKEILIQKTMNLGSHMLLWGEEINEKMLTASTGHFFHIHFLHYLHQLKKGMEEPLI